MSLFTETVDRRVPQYAGLRMSAEKYLLLEEDGHQYELNTGVVVLSPSPTPKHQQILAEILAQLMWYLRSHPVGAVYPETDIKLDEDLVYRPELVFIQADRVAENWERVRVAPDLVVEIISPETRRYDSETKKADYEHYGIREYWLIDPDRATMTFYRLESNGYVEAAAQDDRFASEAVPGFVLDLASVRKAFRPLKQQK